MKQNKSIDEMSIDELKICAYDLIATSQQVNNQLQVVNNLIAKKLNEVQPETNGVK